MGARRCSGNDAIIGRGGSTGRSWVASMILGRGAMDPEPAAQTRTSRRSRARRACHRGSCRCAARLFMQYINAARRPVVVISPIQPRRGLRSRRCTGPLAQGGLNAERLARTWSTAQAGGSSTCHHPCSLLHDCHHTWHQQGDVSMIGTRRSHHASCGRNKAMDQLTLADLCEHQQSGNWPRRPSPPSPSNN